MENAKRNPRTIGMEKNQTKPSGEPAVDVNTGAPCAQDHVKGEYRQWRGESAPSSDDNSEG